MTLNKLTINYSLKLCLIISLFEFSQNIKLFIIINCVHFLKGIFYDLTYHNDVHYDIIIIETNYKTNKLNSIACENMRSV